MGRMRGHVVGVMKGHWGQRVTLFETEWRRVGGGRWEDVVYRNKSEGERRNS